MVVIGTSTEKTDSNLKATGDAVYGSDLHRENQLYGALLRSNQPHARVESVSLDEALTVDGVVTGIGRNDLLGQFDDRVYHYGDVIAAVAAETPDIADEAVRAITANLSPLESVHDPFDALSADAVQVQENNLDQHQPRHHDITVDNDDFVLNIDDYHTQEFGDVDHALQKSEYVLRERYVNPRVNPCNLDTHCCIAEWEEDVLILTESVGLPREAEKFLAGFLGLRDEQITVKVPPTASSSFGARSLPKPSLEPVAATLAKETGRPVKLWFDREAEFTATDNRHKTYYDVEMGLTDDGVITGLRLGVVADTGPYPNGVGHIVLMNSRDRPLDLYKIDNYEYEGVSVFTNNLPSGEYRGIGSTQLMYALDSHIDEMARQAGLDPIAVRDANFVEEGYTPAYTDNPIGSCGLAECLERAQLRFDELRSHDANDRDIVRGWGVGANAHTTGLGHEEGGDATEVEIRFEPSGEVQIYAAAIDHGQGSDTVLGQIAAEELGINPDIVTVNRFAPDSDLEDDYGSVASRSTYIIGAAVRNGARKLKRLLRERAAERIGVDVSEVNIDGGSVATTSGERRPLSKIVGDSEPVIQTTASAESNLTPSAYAIDFAEVEVDTATGTVNVSTFVAAQDVGFAINPKMVEGQIEGSILHGIEFALYSEVQLDQGTPQNANLAEYPVISPLEMPDSVECVLVESNEETGPYGAKGVGTPSTPAVAPAILNAIRDATGERFTRPPVSHEAVYRAVQD